MNIFRRKPRDQEPVRSLSGRLAGPEPEPRSTPPVMVTNAANDRIRQVEEQLQREAEEERQRLLEEMTP